jgi:chemotaxis signal transduction protein
VSAAVPDARVDTAARLRQAFDRSFADAQAAPPAAFADLLAIQVGGDPHLLRLSEINSLHADHAVVAVPSDDPRFLGIGGFRNVLAPIFDLRLLLGYPAGPRPRWLVLAHGPAPVGLAFDRFDGHARVAADLLAAALAEQKTAEAVRGAVSIGGVARPVIQLSAVFDLISRQTLPAPPAKER